MLIEQLKRLYGSLSPGQRWTILAAAVVLAAGTFAFSRWQHEASFRPLYSALSPEDAASVVQKLHEENVEYRITNNGATILVPEAKVPELRLEMAGAGLPKTGRIGFEIFDKNNFGATDFAEHVNYGRALEGELERSVMSLAQVEMARVHITFPKDSVYLDAREPAKASVLIRLRSGVRLPDSAVPAITNLVASAVEGLSPDAVSVLDMQGTLLNRPKAHGGADGLDGSDSALDYQNKVEKELAAKLNATLEPLLGAGRFRTGVSADVDMTSGEQSEESYDPAKSVMVTSQKTEDIAGTQASGGQPGTASNLPRPAPRAAGGNGQTARRTENITYQSSRTVKHVRLAVGAIKRLSVSVLIDNDVQWETKGGKQVPVVTPPSPERLKVIRDLVSVTAGLNPQRGDQLIVESLPFESTLSLTPTPLSPPASNRARPRTSLSEMLQDKKLLGGAVSAVILIVVLAVYFLSMRRRTRTAAYVAQEHALPAAPQDAYQQSRSIPSPGQSDAAWPESKTAPVASLNPGRFETLTTHLKDTASKDTELCVGVLRGWLHEGGA